jgi:7-keto-8-aminopelargonate synthetase-like enzyme
MLTPKGNTSGKVFFLTFRFSDHMILQASTPGRTAQTVHGEWLFFSGYSYLGIQNEPNIIAEAEKAYSQYGWLYPSARISNTPLRLYEEAEAKLSQLTLLKETVLMGNGLVAGRAAISQIKEGSKVLASTACHPAIDTGEKFKGSFDEWTNYCLDEIHRGANDIPIYIVSDAVNPLTAEVYDFSFLQNVKKPVTCIIDDSHGIGLLGNQGEGISSRLPRLPHIAYMITYSLSKALHLPGGAISCSNKSDAEALRKTIWYAASTPPAPAPLHVWLQHAETYANQRKVLRKNAEYLHQKIGHLPVVKWHPELPVFLLPTALDASFFQQHQILISSFSYPDPKGTPINRVVLSALHTNDDMDKLSAVIHLGITTKA